MGKRKYNGCIELMSGALITPTILSHLFDLTIPSRSRREMA